MVLRVNSTSVARDLRAATSTGCRHRTAEKLPAARCQEPPVDRPDPRLPADQTVRGDGRDGYYVGMTGLPLEERFANHKRGVKSSGIVCRCGVAIAWELFEGIPPMSYKEAALTEPNLADDLRDLGYLVYGPTNRKRPARQKRRVKRRRFVGRAGR